MPRLFAAALAVFLLFPVASAQDRTDLSTADPIAKLAYAVGFRAAATARDDSATFAHFRYETFIEGFQAGLTADSSRLAYLMGYDLGQRIAEDQDITIPPAVFLSGFREGLAFDDMGLSEAEMREVMTAVQDSAFVRGLRSRAATGPVAAQRLAELRANLATGDSLLAAVATKEGAVTTPSGLVYIVRTPGTGAEAVPTSRVRINYSGTLADGSVFDESQDSTTVFSLQNVVAGFAEGMTGMRVGEARTFVLPARLGYGLEGTPGGPIPPGAALTFDVTLLELIAPDPEPPSQAD